MGLPNVHVGDFHIADVARKYGTVMNCNVLPGELKHKDIIALSREIYTDLKVPSDIGKRWLTHRHPLI